VYGDFVDSFESDMTPGTKEFVKAGVAQDGKYSAGTKERYRPSNVPQVPKKKQPNVLDQAAQIQPKLPIKRKKEKSQREIFLEEMKQEQAARESRAAARKSGNRAGMSEPTQSLDGRNTMFDIAPAADSYAGVKGSFADADDDLTTNLYVGNLSPGTNEDYLARTFGIHGAIASVKIMWPRTDEERARGRNSGFVQYMERKSAERAKNALDGTMQNDMKMVVAWGKPVARPMVAMYPATVQTAAGFSAVGGWSVTQLGAMVRTPAGLGPAGSQQPALHAPRIPTHAPSITIVVKPPETMDIMLVRAIIIAPLYMENLYRPCYYSSSPRSCQAADKLAEYVREDGWVRSFPPSSGDIIPSHSPYKHHTIIISHGNPAAEARTALQAFEQLILEKEADNPLFNFVHHTMSPDHTYYRWRCYSLANGDSIQKFRTAPFQMYAGGPMWQPPTVQAAQGRLSALSVFLCKSIFYGAFVWARRALTGLKWRLLARAVPGPGGRGRGGAHKFTGSVSTCFLCESL
jgi:U2-associated protein SR140